MNTNMIFLLTIASTVFTTISCQKIIKVKVDLDETIEDYDSASIKIVKNAADRNLVCSISGQHACTTACASQPCTNSCQAQCGFLIPRYVTFSCQTVAATTCTSG